MGKSKSHPCKCPASLLKGSYPNLVCKRCRKDHSPKPEPKVPTIMEGSPSGS